MFRHYAPTTIRIVTLALALVPCVTSTSIAVSGELSTESEWATQNSPLTFALREGVTLTLAPGTKVVRKPSIPVPVHLKDLAPRAYAVELVSGRLDVNIDTTHKPIYSVMVRGPRRTAAFSNGGHLGGDPAGNRNSGCVGNGTIGDGERQMASAARWHGFGRDARDALRNRARSLEEPQFAGQAFIEAECWRHGVNDAELVRCPRSPKLSSFGSASNAPRLRAHQ